MFSSHSLRKLFLLIIFSFLIPITSFAAKGVPVAKGTDLHHIFPKEVECFNYFTSIGINPHLFTIPLNKDEHILLHKHNFLAGAGARYNDAWKKVFVPFVPSNDPSATLNSIL